MKKEEKSKFSSGPLGDPGSYSVGDIYPVFQIWLRPLNRGNTDMKNVRIVQNPNLVFANKITFLSRYYNVKDF